MSFETTGVLHKVFPTETKKNNFQVRFFVLKTEGQYPQYIKFQLTQDKCDQLDRYTEGQNIKVFFDLRGNEWNGNYITNLNAWKLDGQSNEGNTSGPKPPTGEDFGEMNQPFPDDDIAAEDFGDLPF